MAKVRDQGVEYQVRPARAPRRSRSTQTKKPTSVASNEPTETRAKLFANGRSQAVRLPREFRMTGTEVLISRDGDRVILQPIPDVPRDARGWPIGFRSQLRDMRDGLDLDDFKIPDDPVPPPITGWDDL